MRKAGKFFLQIVEVTENDQIVRTTVSNIQKGDIQRRGHSFPSKDGPLPEEVAQSLRSWTAHWAACGARQTKCKDKPAADKFISQVESPLYP